MAQYNNNSYTYPNYFRNYNLGNTMPTFNSTSQLTIVNVKGEEGAMNYPVAAGNTVLLMDFDSNQFWLKSTAQNGSQMPMRYFSFVENTPKVETHDTNSQFVTKKELDDLKAYLGNQFQGIKTQLNNIRKPENGGDK